MIETITVSGLKEKLEKENCQLIDVREVPEYEAVRINGFKLVPLSEFQDKMKIIDKNLDSYFLCGVGKRAMKAAEYLESLGYKNLYVIDGGIKAWIEAGYPVESGNLQ